MGIFSPKFSGKISGANDFPRVFWSTINTMEFRWVRFRFLQMCFQLLYDVQHWRFKKIVFTKGTYMTLCRRLPVGWLSFGLPMVWTGPKLYEKYYGAYIEYSNAIHACNQRSRQTYSRCIGMISMMMSHCTLIQYPPPRGRGGLWKLVVIEPWTGKLVAI